MMKPKVNHQYHNDVIVIIVIHICCKCCYYAVYSNLYIKFTVFEYIIIDII